MSYIWDMANVSNVRSKLNLSIITILVQYSRDLIYCFVPIAKYRWVT